MTLGVELVLRLGTWQSPAGPLMVTADIKNLPKRVMWTDRVLRLHCVWPCSSRVTHPGKEGWHSLQGLLCGGERICMGKLLMWEGPRKLRASRADVI